MMDEDRCREVGVAEHYCDLRKKLGFEGTLIQTIRDIGYVLVRAADISR